MKVELDTDTHGHFCGHRNHGASLSRASYTINYVAIENGEHVTQSAPVCLAHLIDTLKELETIVPSDAAVG